MPRGAVPQEHLVWRRTEVLGRPATYGEAGAGPLVVFLHGWGLADHAYKAALKRVAHLGARVLAPAMPGFGGTPALPAEQFSLVGYADWVDDFLRATGADQPVHLVGHSFGGAVAIKVAHDHRERVRSLVLVNSVGGSAWRTDRRLSERPLWDWGINVPGEVLPLGYISRVLPVILGDAIPNLIRNPIGLWRVAQLVRRVDLSAELEGLRKRKVPVVVLWGDKDRLITRASFDALCAAVGAEGEIVNGNHSWLLAHPDEFGRVMTNVLGVARLAADLDARRRPTIRKLRVRKESAA